MNLPSHPIDKSLDSKTKLPDLLKILKLVKVLIPALLMILSLSFKPSPLGVNALGTSNINTGGGVMFANAVAILIGKK